MNLVNLVFPFSFCWAQSKLQLNHRLSIHTSKLIELIRKDNLLSKIDRVGYKLSPKSSQAYRHRCLHTDRLLRTHAKIHTGTTIGLYWKQCRRNFDSYSIFSEHSGWMTSIAGITKCFKNQSSIPKMCWCLRCFPEGDKKLEASLIEARRGGLTVWR